MNSYGLFIFNFKLKSLTFLDIFFKNDAKKKATNWQPFFSQNQILLLIRFGDFYQLQTIALFHLC